MSANEHRRVKTSTYLEGKGEAPWERSQLQLALIDRMLALSQGIEVTCKPSKMNVCHRKLVCTIENKRVVSKKGILSKTNAYQICTFENKSAPPKTRDRLCCATWIEEM